jgi:hypothetical protein
MIEIAVQHYFSGDTSVCLSLSTLEKMLQKSNSLSLKLVRGGANRIRGAVKNELQSVINLSLICHESVMRSRQISDRLSGLYESKASAGEGVTFGDF